ncbi:MAG: phytanoyl-CoA dioxygenase family protein [Myxococcales bacterium]|nr:phytanoyl-CoA dioxygenase family protein [Myxococcales bacterium]
MSQARIERVAADAPIDEMLAILERDGAVIVERLLASDVVARINDEVAVAREAANPSMEHLNPAIGFFFGKRTRHVSGLPGRSRTFACEVMVHPTLLALCDAILLPSCARYQLNLGHLIDRGPGSEPQLLHRDEDVWVHVPRPHGELQLATMIALDDFRAELGATRIVPGSHRWPRERSAEPSELAVAEMPAGSAAIYLGSTIHAGGANTTSDRWRRGLHTSFVCGWLRTEENNYLACPPDVARTLPRLAQEVLGYAVHDAIASAGGYAGALDLQDPCDLMAEGKL